jgi:hypothetical protein
MTRSAVERGLQAQQRVYMPNSVAYALSVRKTAVQKMEDSSRSFSPEKLITASFPSYRLQMDSLRRFLIERFGSYNFNVEVSLRIVSAFPAWLNHVSFRFHGDQYTFRIPASLSTVRINLSQLPSQELRDYEVVMPSL